MVLLIYSREFNNSFRKHQWNTLDFLTSRRILFMRRIIAVINLHFIVATRKWMAGTGSFKINKPLIENNISILFIDCSTWKKKTAYYDPINNHHLTHRDDACKRDTSYHISTCTQQALTVAFRVVVTRGIMKYFKFSFALFGHYQSGRLFPRLLFHRNPKPNHADRSIAIEKNAQLGANQSYSNIDEFYKLFFQPTDLSDQNVAQIMAY